MRPSILLLLAAPEGRTRLRRACARMRRAALLLLRHNMQTQDGLRLGRPHRRSLQCRLRLVRCKLPSRGRGFRFERAMLRVRRCVRAQQRHISRAKRFRQERVHPINGTQNTRCVSCRNRDIATSATHPAWMHSAACSSSTLAVSAKIGSRIDDGRMPASNVRNAEVTSVPRSTGMSMSSTATSKGGCCTGGAAVAPGGGRAKLAFSTASAAPPSATAVTTKSFICSSRVKSRRLSWWSSAMRTWKRGRLGVAGEQGAATSCAVTMPVADSAAALTVRMRCCAASAAAVAAVAAAAAPSPVVASTTASAASAASSGGKMRTGTLSSKVEPLPGSDWTVKLPPMRRANALLTVKRGARAASAQGSKAP